MSKPLWVKNSKPSYTSTREAALDNFKKLSKKIVENENGCWIWTGCLTMAGYGLVTIRYKNYYVHRLMAAYAYFWFEETDHVMHDCDVRRCCNPDHLTLGSITENNQDMFKKGRARPKGKIPKSYKGKPYNNPITE